MKRLMAFLCAFLFASIGVADERSDRISFSLSGTIESRSLKLVLWDGELLSIRVYSEPSHTLLGVYVNTASQAREASADWLDATFPSEQRPSRFPIMRFPFANGTKTEMQLFDWGPVTDRAIAVHLNGFWATSESREPVEPRERVVTVQTDPREFVFSASASLLDTELCCGETAPCTRDCTTCKDGQQLSCCFTNATGCPWCGKLVAQCEPCGICGG